MNTQALSPAIHAVRNYGLRNPRTIRPQSPHPLSPMRQLIRQCGHYPAARCCAKLGIAFEDAYFMAFGRYPKPRRGNGCRRPFMPAC